MFRIISFAILGLTLLASCSKKTNCLSTSSVYIKYADNEPPPVIEEIYADWDGKRLALVAEGFDHEQLKIYLPEVNHTGRIINISEQNLGFGDGLDFESTRVLEGSIYITELSREKISGNFNALLLDDINGTEQRRVEGSSRSGRNNSILGANPPASAMPRSPF